MNDLGDLRQRRIVELEPPQQRLEGAAVALVRVLGLEHVESQLSRLRLVTLRRDELEARVGVDEALDEPCARDAVDEDALPRDPRPPVRPLAPAYTRLF